MSREAHDAPGAHLDRLCSDRTRIKWSVKSICSESMRMRGMWQAMQLFEGLTGQGVNCGFVAACTTDPGKRSLTFGPVAPWHARHLPSYSTVLVALAP